MTKSIAQSLINDPSQPKPKDMAKNLAKEFFTNPSRGYGENLVVVFNKLRANEFSDPFQPAREPANFTSSSDNAAASRITPVALLYCNNYDHMMHVAKQSIKITHTHKEGVLGGLVQCIAIQQSLLSPPKDLNGINYVDQLIDKITPLEQEQDG